MDDINRLIKFILGWEQSLSFARMVKNGFSIQDSFRASLYLDKNYCDLIQEYYKD